MATRRAAGDGSAMEGVSRSNCLATRWTLLRESVSWGTVKLKLGQPVPTESSARSCRRKLPAAATCFEHAGRHTRRVGHAVCDGDPGLTIMSSEMSSMVNSSMSRPCRRGHHVDGIARRDAASRPARSPPPVRCRLAPAPGANLPGEPTRRARSAPARSLDEHRDFNLAGGNHVDIDTPRTARARNILSATPVCRAMPSPTTEIFATSSSSCCNRSSALASATASCYGLDRHRQLVARGTVKEMSVFAFFADVLDDHVHRATSRSATRREDLANARAGNVRHLAEYCDAGLVAASWRHR